MSLAEVLDFIELKGLITLCIIASFCYYAFSSTKKPSNFPPGPRGFPFLGIVPLVGRRPEIIFANWGKKYGDVIGVKMGNNYAVILNSYDAIQEALVKNAKVFSHRPDNEFFTGLLGKEGIAFADYTPEYINRRKFAHATLSKLGFGKTSLEDPIANEATHLLDEFGDGDIEINEEARLKIMKATGNAIAQVTFGKRYSDYQDPEYERLLKGMEAFIRNGPLAYLTGVIFPKLLFIPPIRGITMAIGMGFENFSAVIEKKIADHEKVFDVADRKDLIDEYLAEMKKNADPGTESSSKESMANVIGDLFGGGMDTTEVTIVFICLLLSNRPEIMKKIHEEIDDVLDVEVKPCYELRERMPFCQAFIMEVMRYRSALPLAIAHCTSENVKFRGYNIPKGTTVLPNIYAVHNDPKNWDEPEKFNPERHLGSNGKVKTSKYFIPFGCGPRQCIGLGLAKMELFIFFVTIFQRYSAVPTPTASCKCPRVQEDASLTGLTLWLPKNTPVTLVRRKSY